MRYVTKARSWPVSLAVLAMILAAPCDVTAQSAAQAAAGPSATAASTGTGVRTPDNEEISDAVDRALLLDPGVNSLLIDVVTTDGIVTLTGTVDSWSEYRAARQNAFEGGAYKVINDLEVATQ